MKNILLAILAFLVIGVATTQAALVPVNVVYDTVANVIRQIPNALTAGFNAAYFNATSTIATSTFAGGITMQGWALSTSTVVCMAPEKCQFQADGVADDVTIQAAVSYSSTTGGNILIKTGSYSLISPVTIDSVKPIFIRGEGPESTIIDIDTEGSDGFIFGSSTRNTVYGGLAEMSVSGKSASSSWHTYTTGTSIKVINKRNARFENLRLAGGNIGVHSLATGVNYHSEHNVFSELFIVHTQSVAFLVEADDNGNSDAPYNNSQTLVNSYLTQNYGESIYLNRESQTTSGSVDHSYFQNTYLYTDKSNYLFRSVGARNSKLVNIAFDSLSGDDAVYLDANSSGNDCTNCGFDGQVVDEGTNGFDVFRARKGIIIPKYFNYLHPTEIALYNTEDELTSYEKGVIKWSANRLLIGTENLGTSSVRDIEIKPSSGTTYASGNLNINSTNTDVIAGEVIGKLSWYTNDVSTIPNREVATIQAVAAQNYFSTDNAPTDLAFLTHRVFDSSVERMRLTNNGFLGINTTVPSTTLHVVGTTTLATTSITALSDITGSIGSNGNILLSTGTSTRWVATSSLGFSAGGGSGTVNSGLLGQVAWYAANGTAVSGTSSISISASSTVSIGTSTASSSELEVQSSVLGGLIARFFDALGNIAFYITTATNIPQHASNVAGFLQASAARVFIGDDAGDGYNKMGTSSPAQLTLNGLMLQESWNQVDCSIVVGQNQISADSITGCDGFSFYEDGTATLTSTAVGGILFGRLSTSAVTDGAGVFLNAPGGGGLIIATSTPLFEAVVRIHTVQNQGTTTQTFIGGSNIVSSGTAYETAPTIGCFFTASSTQANWLAVCQTAAAVQTIVNTGIASSTVTTGDGVPYRFLIQTGTSSARFFMQTSEAGALTQVAHITTNVPNTTALNWGVHFGRVSSATAVGVDVYDMNVGWRKVLAR